MILHYFRLDAKKTSNLFINTFLVGIWAILQRYVDFSRFEMLINFQTK